MHREVPNGPIGSKCGWPVPLMLALGLSSGVAAGGVGGLPPMNDPVGRPVRGVREFSGQIVVKPRAGVVAGAAGVLPVGAKLISTIAETGEWVVRVPAGSDDGRVAANLAASGRFEYAEPDWVVFLQGTPNDPMYSSQWHHPRMGNPAAWNIWTGSPAMTVGIVDSGIDLTHPEFASRLVSGYNAASKVAQSAGGDVSDVSSVGHGTAVAGCIGAIGNNAVGVAGMGWNFRLMPIRASNDSSGSAVLTNVLAGCRWAVDNGAKVINASYAGVNSPSVQTTGAYIRDRGGILVWASGNSGSTLPSAVDWPDVLIVGAVDKADGRPTWANYGPALDMVAPGVDIHSTTRGSAYSIYEGTSFASPLAAGAIALAWSAAPSLSRDEVIAAVQSACTDLGAPGEDDLYGRGRVDTYAATLKAWREAHVLTPPIAMLNEQGPVDPIQWPIRTATSVEYVFFGDLLNAAALELSIGDRIESTSIDLSNSDPESTQLRFWTFRSGDAEIVAEYLNNEGEWMLLIDLTGYIDGPVEHAWALPADAMHDRLALRMTVDGSAGEKIYISTVTVAERCTADFDGSGFVDTDDFTMFVLAFQAGAQSADVDLSGFVDTDDFTMFVMSFAEGC